MKNGPIWNFKGQTDASDLGLKPGEWPEIVAARCPDGTERLFTRRGKNVKDGETLWVTYDCTPADGHYMELLVFND